MGHPPGVQEEFAGRRGWQEGFQTGCALGSPSRNSLSYLDGCGPISMWWSLSALLGKWRQIPHRDAVRIHGDPCHCLHAYCGPPCPSHLLAPRILNVPTRPPLLGSILKRVHFAPSTPSRSEMRPLNCIPRPQFIVLISLQLLDLSKPEFPHVKTKMKRGPPHWVVVRIKWDHEFLLVWVVSQEYSAKSGAWGPAARVAGFAGLRDPHLTPPGLKEGEMTWKEQLGLQDDKCCFQCVTGTPATAQASHSKPWKTSVRDGENAIASLSFYLSLPFSSQ